MSDAKNILSIASAEVGIKEDPPGSNKVKYNTWLWGKEVSGKQYPWCMAFVQWVFNKAGLKIPLVTASCNALVRFSKSEGTYVTEDYKAGDVVFFDFKGTGITHVGIIESVAEAGIVSIEGNTSVTSNDNGGSVMRRSRPWKYIAGAYRPKYVEDDDMTYEQFCEYMDKYMAVEGTGDEPSEWAKEATAWAKTAHIVNGDGKGNFGWQKPITREASVQIMYNKEIR